MEISRVDRPFIFEIHSFSGPLDLLLQLVKENKMDLLDIDLSKITDQYMNYLTSIPQPDLNHAGDFIRMASWLLYLKSKSLIPEEEQEEEEPDFQELKKKLSKLLIFYKRFQKLADFFNKKNILGRDCWKSGHKFLFDAPPEEDKKIQIRGEKALLQLSSAYYKKILAQSQKNPYEIKQPIPTLMHRLKETAGFFKLGLRLKFSQLILVNKAPHSLLLSFLSLLELSKSGFIRLFQEKLFSNIDIKVTKTMTSDALQNISQDISSEESPQALEPKNISLEESPQALEPENISLEESPQALKPKNISSEESPQALESENRSSEESPQALEPENRSSEESSQALEPENISSKESPQALEPENISSKESPQALEPENISSKESPQALEPENISLEESPQALEPENISLEESPQALEPENRV